MLCVAEWVICKNDETNAKMQKDMAKAQEELAEKVVEGTAGGGMVTVKANGQKKSWMLSSKKKSLILKILICFKI